MKYYPPRLFLSIFCIIMLLFQGRAQQPARGFLWQIGRPDHDMREFALAPSGYPQFRKDAVFVIGVSHENTDWPYTQPGPDDDWAGSRVHNFSILFGLGAEPTQDSCILQVRLADVGNRQVDLEIVVNGHRYNKEIPQGAGQVIFGEGRQGKEYTFDLVFPSGLLIKGDNIITITSKSGSWMVYDWLGLQTDQALKLTPLRSAIRVTALKAQPWLSMQDHVSCQSVQLSLLNTGQATELTCRYKGQAPHMIHCAAGQQTVELFIPAVEKDSTLELTLEQGHTLISQEKVLLQPVRKMTVYILPHSHNDIGYTELQSKVEAKQLNNLLKGIDFAQKTKDYPEGARFVWNLEGSYAADLFLQRMSPEQKQAFYTAVTNGSVALNGMYFNTLTGLCRPEELLQLFHYSSLLAQQCHVTLDAAMISDVPGYSWGTVTAMAQAGIKYFSAAPNYFDRIGDILQKWEDKPFYWSSPSGAEKVLVWIPYKGYALSHGLPGGLNANFVTDYMHQLEKINYPYDITYIRWSGHGDNAEPEIAISDFVKDWNTKYTWPKFIISSTSTAFRAFEKEYGDQLPAVKGDWTGYWEDGAGSSAVQTAENRASSSRLTQAETLWAMLQPDTRPLQRFNEAWRNILLYSEHTWGAYCSVTDPLNPITLEQWAVKKSYADTASRLSEELLAGALPVASTPAIDVYNTNSWAKTGLVLVPATLSTAGDLVRDEKGGAIPSQRLSTGELAFVAQQVAPFSRSRYFIGSAKKKDRKTGSGRTGVNMKQDRNEMGGVNPVLDNGILRVTIDTVTGVIRSLVDHTINNDFVDTAKGAGLNDYLFLPGNKPEDLRRNGKVTISLKEKGSVLSTLSITSEAPGCNKLTREVMLVNGFDHIELTDILDKKAAELNPHPGDYAWANTGGKESVNFGFPFRVPGGQIKLDIPLAVMRPETDQIPSACKNWLEVGGWADVSNEGLGITWSTLDAPLVELGGITANLLGGQTNPDVWRKYISPTQELYSWALNNHWETNYRASQEGIISFRYALQPHGVFDPVKATQFATGLSEPLIVAAAGPGPSQSFLRLSSDQIIVLKLTTSDDGKAWILTLFNPGSVAVSTRLLWANPIKKVYFSNTGELPLSDAPDELTLKGLDVLTLRVEK